jgi:hypothetical protein
MASFFDEPTVDLLTKIDEHCFRNLPWAWPSRPSQLANPSAAGNEWQCVYQTEP